MNSFKQFLLESVATPSNVDTAFIVGKVAFDNKAGLGATPNNANVAYKGAVAWMKPSSFRKLAHEADRSADAKKLVAMLEQGKAIGCPFLVLELKEGSNNLPVSVKVNGHEGRARADAFKALNGDVLMPVHLFFNGGLRARDLTDELFHWIAEHGIIPENDGAPTASISRVFVSGRDLKL